MRVLGASHLPTGTALGYLPIWNLLELSHIGTAPGISSSHSHSCCPLTPSSHWDTSWTITFPSHSCNSWYVSSSSSHLYSSCTPTMSSCWYSSWCVQSPPEKFWDSHVYLSLVQLSASPGSPLGSFLESHNFFLLVYLLHCHIFFPLGKLLAASISPLGKPSMHVDKEPYLAP